MSRGEAFPEGAGSFVVYSSLKKAIAVIPPYVERHSYPMCPLALSALTQLRLLGIRCLARSR